MPAPATTPSTNSSAPTSVDGGDGTDTIAVTTTWLDLNSASDAQIVNVEAVSAEGAGSGVTIDLSGQSEGFSITGSAFADHITGTSSDDTINNFIGADNVDGGDGTDTLALTADLNGAGDTQIRNIETVSAAGAPAGVTIDLGGQLEGFAITGSAFADTITGASWRRYDQCRRRRRYHHRRGRQRCDRWRRRR